MTLIDKPGLRLDVPEQDYHADCAPEPSLSRGIVATLVTRSPLHAKLEHPRLSKVEPEDPNAAMDYGSLGHKLILGKGATVQVGEWDDWRKDAAKDFRAKVRLAGGIPVLQKVYEQALAMEEAVQAEFARLKIKNQFAAGKSEVAAFWQEDGFWLRALFDRLVMEPDSAIIFDLKITENAHPDVCTQQISRMNYDLQDAHYLRGLEKLFPNLAGRTRFIFLFVEKAPPFAVTPIELSGEFKKLAQMQWERGFALWKKCNKENVWPSYTETVVRAEPPAWRMSQELKKEYENQ